MRSLRSSHFIACMDCPLFIQMCTRNLSKAHEMCNSLNSSCSHIVLVYLKPFHRNLPLKYAPLPKIAKKY